MTNFGGDLGEVLTFIIAHLLYTISLVLPSWFGFVADCSMVLLRAVYMYRANPLELLSAKGGFAVPVELPRDL